VSSAHPPPDEEELNRLRKSEARLRAILEAAIDAIITTTDRGVITSVNPSAVRIFGYEEHEMVGQNIRMLMPEPFHSRHDGYVQRYRETGEPRVIGIGRIVEGRRRDGSTFPLELTLSEVRLEDGTRKFAGIARDVSDRQAGESALRESEARFRDLFENASDLIQATDVQGRILLANRAWRRTLGFDAERVAGLRVRDVIAADFHDESLPAFHRTWDDFDTKRIRTELEASDGRRVVVDGTVWCRTHNDRVVATWAIFRDVTREVELERVKKEFVSVVSHELRTPLTSIRGSLGLLNGGVAGELPEKAARLIDVANKNTERLIRLVNEILDLDKLEAGKLELRVERVDVAQMVRSVVESISTLAGQGSVNIAHDVDPSLTVAGDPDRLEQVLTNLVANAIKFSPADSMVRVQASALEDMVKVAVVDQGAGIEASDLPKLFLKFQQLEPADRRAHEGSGLGLAISKAIVEAHHGNIGVDSAPGEGSTFWFTVPMDARSRHAEPARARVLVAAGDEEFRSKLIAAFEPLGLEAAGAATASQAFAQLEASKFDAVLVDQSLQQGDGWQLVRSIRDLDARQRIAVMSDFIQSEHETTRRIEELGLSMVLGKPVTTRFVAETMGAVIDDSFGRPRLIASRSALADKLASLRAGFRETLVGRLDELEGNIRQALAEGVESQAFRSALHAAHKLRGTAGTYGFAHVGAYVASIEQQLEAMLHQGETDFAKLWNDLRLAREAMDETP
jgi:PAS domain S-box-containing protein